jgi:hypothetical protein
MVKNGDSMQPVDTPLGVFEARMLAHDKAYVMSAAPFELYVWTGEACSEADADFAHDMVEELAEAEEGWFVPPPLFAKFGKGKPAL